jgi:manganese-dependent inorganic pyrophosphatase
VDPDHVAPLFVRVAAMDLASFDGLQDREGIPPEQTIIVVGDRRDIQERSIERGVRLLVISGGLEVDAEVAPQARQAGVSVISCAYDSASTAWAIRSAARVDGIMAEEGETFPPEETLRSVRRRTATLGPAVFMVTDDEDRLVGVFSRRDILRPSETRLILVDHNELSQAVPGAEEAEIVEVVDHHRLGT